jgi:hypothetical protein
MLNVLREHLFTPDSWERVTARLEFVVDESAIIAEDDAGNRFDYAERRTADRCAS